jgi:peptidoglycan/LPS O-acetylase OafA/YrhL
VAAVLVLITGAGLWHGASRGSQWQVQWMTSVLLAAATFGVGMAARNPKVPRTAAWLGVISYSVYLLHPLIFDVFRTVRPLHRLNQQPMPIQGLVFAVLALVIIAASALTYYLIEKPMQRLGHWIAGRSRVGYTAGETAGSGEAAAGAGTVGTEAARSTSSSSAVAGGSGGSP